MASTPFHRVCQQFLGRFQSGSRGAQNHSFGPQVADQELDMLQRNRQVQTSACRLDLAVQVQMGRTVGLLFATGDVLDGADIGSLEQSRHVAFRSTAVHVKPDPFIPFTQPVQFRHDIPLESLRTDHAGHVGLGDHHKVGAPEPRPTPTATLLIPGHDSPEVIEMICPAREVFGDCGTAAVGVQAQVEEELLRPPQQREQVVQRQLRGGSDQKFPLGRREEMG